MTEQSVNALLTALGIGGTVGGSILGARATGKANAQNQANTERMFGMADAETARRNQLQALLMPQIMAQMRRQPLGAPNPSMGYTAPAPTATAGGGYTVPGTPGAVGSAFKGGMGGAGIGATIGSKIGAIGGPLGMGIGAGVGALAGLVKNKAGAGEENRWVQGVQNKFGRDVAGVIDPIDRFRSQGTLTPEQRQAAQQQLESLWAQYNAAGREYAGQGAKQSRTIGQSHQTLDPLMEQWRASLLR